MSRTMLLTALVAWGAGLPVAAQPAQTPPPELLRSAQEFVEFLVREDFSGAVQRFDDTLRRELPPERLRGIWREIIAQAGAFQRQIEARSQQGPGSDVIVIVTCQFERDALDLRITFNTEKRVTGLLTQPGRMSLEFRPPPYADPGRFTEQEVIVGAQQWPLPGTLSIPRDGGPHPAIVIVHGSGPGDRDGTHGPNKQYRDLAWGLASRGIAVLRYDKRTRVHPERMGRIREPVTVNEETVDDAVAAVAVLRGTARIDPRRIFVLGHSLGGMMVPRIGSRDPGIAGFIISAGPTRPMEDIVLAQTIYLASLDGVITEEEQKHIEETRRQVARVKDPALSPAVPPSELLGIHAAYWLDLRGYRPAVAARNLNRPLLILQGGRDFQVTLEDFEGWQRELSQRPDVTFRLYPALNHRLMEGQGPASPADYQRPGHVALSVIEDIANWIIGRR